MFPSSGVLSYFSTALYRKCSYSISQIGKLRLGKFSYLHKVTWLVTMAKSGIQQRFVHSKMHGLDHHVIFETLGHIFIF